MKQGDYKKQKHILIIQFRTDASYLHERMCLYKSLLSDVVRLTMVSALDNDIDWKHPVKLLRGVDGVVLGGSGEFHFPGHTDGERQKFHDCAVANTKMLVQYLIDYDIPTIGICFGHQMLGYVLETQTIRDPHQAKKAGSYQIRLTEEGKQDRLFSGLPETFMVQYAHQDSLEGLPKGCVLLAHNGNRCRTSAFRHGKNVYGFQFHPEFVDEKDFFFRLKISDAEYSGNTTQVCATREATTLLKRFVRDISHSYKKEF